MAVGTRDPDLRVADTVAPGPATLVVEHSDARQRLASFGYQASAYVALPSLGSAAMFVPLGQTGVARYAVDNWTFSRARWKRARNRIASKLIDAGLRPPGTDVVTVAGRYAGPPFLVAAAEAEGLLAGRSWFLVGGEGDALSRGAFFVFPSGARVPSWVLKFARVPGYTDAFDRDDRGLALVAAAGKTASSRAPAAVGRFTAAGLEASVETAAPGRRLSGLLRSSAHRAEKLALVDAIAAWILEVECETARPPDHLDSELERLRRDVLPRWKVSPELVDPVVGVAGVLAHNDLGSWNVVVRGTEFTVVDWESARGSGLPVWDLWYFLADALAQIDCRSDAERVLYFERLFRGEAACSTVLFRWTREFVTALGLEEPAVAPLATLCWLHHGLSREARQRSLNSHATAETGRTWAADGYARTWLTGAGLGATWDAWRRP